MAPPDDTHELNRAHSAFVRKSIPELRALKERGFFRITLEDATGQGGLEGLSRYVPGAYAQVTCMAGSAAQAGTDVSRRQRNTEFDAFFRQGISDFIQDHRRIEADIQALARVNGYGEERDQDDALLGRARDRYVKTMAALLFAAISHDDPQAIRDVHEGLLPMGGLASIRHPDFWVSRQAAPATDVDVGARFHPAIVAMRSSAELVRCLLDCGWSPLDPVTYEKKNDVLRMVWPFSRFLEDRLQGKITYYHSDVMEEILPTLHEYALRKDSEADLDPLRSLPSEVQKSLVQWQVNQFVYRKTGVSVNLFWPDAKEQPRKNLDLAISSGIVNLDRDRLLRAACTGLDIPAMDYFLNDADWAGFRQFDNPVRTVVNALPRKLTTPETAEAAVIHVIDHCVRAGRTDLVFGDPTDPEGRALLLDCVIAEMPHAIARCLEIGADPHMRIGGRPSALMVADSVNDGIAKMLRAHLARQEALKALESIDLASPPGP